MRNQREPRPLPDDAAFLFAETKSSSGSVGRVGDQRADALAVFGRSRGCGEIPIEVGLLHRVQFRTLHEQAMQIALGPPAEWDRGSREKLRLFLTCGLNVGLTRRAVWRCGAVRRRSQNGRAVISKTGELLRRRRLGDDLQKPVIFSARFRKQQSFQGQSGRHVFPILLTSRFVLLTKPLDVGHDDRLGAFACDPIIAALVSGWPAEDSFKRQLKETSRSFHQHRSVLLRPDFTAFLHKAIAHEARFKKDDRWWQRPAGSFRRRICSVNQMIADFPSAPAIL